MRYDAEHKGRTREKVLDEAVRAIRLEGLGQVGVAGVMQRVGLTHGGFYAHFESRDDLVLAAVERMFADVQGAFERLAGDLPPAEALRTYVRFYLSRSHRDAPDTGCPLPLLSSDPPRMGDPARRRFQEGVTRLTERLRGLLEQLDRPDADRLAASVLAEMIGALSLSRAVSDRQQSDAILMSSRLAVLGRLGLTEGTA